MPRKVKLHFIGEHHAADFSLPRNETTLARLRRAIEDSRKKGEKTVVALEIDPERVEKLKRTFKDFDREVTEKDVEKIFGEGYGWMKGYANLMRKYKDVEFIGADIDTGNKERRKAALDLARWNYDFINKAMSEEVWSKLTDEEKSDLKGIAQTLGRNEVIRLNIMKAISEKKADRIIYVGGSAHSTIAKRIKDELKKYDIKVENKIEHNFEDELKRYTGNLRMVTDPSNALTRAVDIKKLEGLSHDQVRDILKKMSELQTWHTNTTRARYKTYGQYSFTAYQAASRGIGLTEKRKPPSKELMDFIKMKLKKVRK